LLVQISRPQELTERLPAGRYYRICSRCVMDTSDPQITFDGDGRCSLCTDFLNTRASSSHYGGAEPQELELMIESVRISGRNSDYDCVIGMSGGVDSTYLAYVLCKRFGLRPLAVHLDNGWNSTVAVRNIRKIVEGLGLAYECVVLDWEEFRGIQLAFLKASVPEAETPTDVAIPEALHAIANSHGIRYIIGGGNLATEGILPKAWHYNARDRKYFTSICSRFGQRLPTKFKFYDYRRELYYKLSKGIKTIYPLNYLPFTSAEAVTTLAADVGYEYYGEKHHESLYSRFIQSYYLPQKFGIDYRRATYSAMIASGQMERSDAIESLTTPPYRADLISEDKGYVAKKLGISSAELDKIIAQPGNWYWQYPNDERKLALVYSLYRRLYNKKKLSSV
jgi:N-acetyl sugar amidotransferase